MIAPEKIQTKYLQMLDDGSAQIMQTRLAIKDVSLWSDDSIVQQSISQRLGWIDCIDIMLTEVDSILKIKNIIVERGFNHCVLLGMGGSSLAPELFSHLFSCQNQNDQLTLQVADNTSPDAIAHINETIDYNKTVFIVASKSGTTIESDSFYRYFYDQVIKNKISDPGQHFVAISDPDTVLVELAIRDNFIHCFVNSADIGGRFSVLSYFGLVPAAFLGIDIRNLLNSAKNELIACCDEQQVSKATELGIILGLGAQLGLDKLFIDLEPQLKPFAAWLEQLVAESSGKASKGILPVIEIMEDSTHSVKHNLQFRLEDGITGDRSSSFYSQLFDISQLGAEFFRWEWATSIAGAVMNINPFDEPNVGENKKVTIEILQSNNGSDDLLNNSDCVVYDDSINSKNKIQSSLQQLLKNSQPTDYFSMLMYCSNTEQVESSMLNFRDQLKDNYKIPSTFGIGPRYLHSTGQLHKGGANNGIFLIVTTEFNNKIDVPGKAFDFGQLNRAQAAGDIQALQSNQRRLLHVHLNSADDQLQELFAETLIWAIN